MRDTIANFFGSILFRLTLIVGALVALTGIAITIAWGVFQSTSNGLDALTSESLPKMQKSADVVALTDEMRGALAEILIARDLSELNARYTLTVDILTRLHAVNQTLPPSEAERLERLTQNAHDALDMLVAARADEFRSATDIAQALAAATGMKLDASTALAALSDTAFAELSAGGAETIATVEGTLTTLVDGHFARLQTMLEIRGETNLLSGLAISATQTRDTAIRTMLGDLGTASGARLETLLPALAADPALADMAETIGAARDTFLGALTGARGTVTPAEILSKRQEVDVALSSALDDLLFETVIESEDAKDASSGAITALLEGQVTTIRQRGALDAASKLFFASLLETALAMDEAELDLRAAALTEDAASLRSRLEGEDAALRDVLSALIAIAEEEAGIVAMRRAGLIAADRAAEAARQAADSVSAIAGSVSALNGEARQAIDRTASGLTAEIVRARAEFGLVAFGAVALVALALLAAWWTVIRPINRITRTTERLAAGNLDPIRGLGRRGELGRLAAALQVFRTGALDQIRLQEEKERTEAAAREAERTAEAERRAAEERDRRQQQERERQEREREKAEQAQRDAARAEAEAERRARAAEQDIVVRELAAGLQNLAAGDLTYRIGQTFAGDYDALRQDFNEAVKTLASLVGQITASATTIDASSSEIATASKDLARRTEGNAASLEETAAALNELTESVSSAAQGATEADTTVQKTRGDAENSRSVMREAIQAMNEIEEFSTRITKITDVIDDISFQTNLLALNAGVEAARAGEAGRGFAVVASEVRALAQRSSDAAQEISQLIAGSTTKIGEGASRVDEAGTALEAVILAIAEISQHVARIAVSAEEQSKGIAEINAAIGQLDQSTQQNVAVFEETTAASQALTGEASTLTRIVAQFRTDEGSEPATEADADPRAA